MCLYMNTLTSASASGYTHAHILAYTARVPTMHFPCPCSSLAHMHALYHNFIFIFLNTIIDW